MFKNSILVFVFSSLAIHFIFFTGLSLTSPQSSVSPKETVEIEIRSANETPKTKQIVSQDQKRLNDEVPTEDAYLSRHNQDVEKQTRVENIGKFKNAQGQGNRGKNSGAKKSEVKGYKKSDGTLTALRSLTPGYDFTKNPSTQDNAGERSANDDNLDDVPVGMETVLRTKEFLYYTYFARIKDKLRKTWGTKVREKVNKMAKRGRYIASTEDKVTKLIIILNSQGILVKVQVVSQSGIIDLDDAAVEAFKAAAPFPNPPNGMIESDGNVRIAWDLVLEA